MNHFKIFFYLQFVVLFFFSLNSYSQNKKQSINKTSTVTLNMAKKIKYACLYNDKLLRFFAISNNISFNSDAEKLLVNLENNLSSVEVFIKEMYRAYGVEKSYFTLKDVGFTIKETDIAEAIWAKEIERIGKIENDNAQNELNAEMKLENDIRNANSNKQIFKNFQNTSKAEIDIDLSDLGIWFDTWKYDNNLLSADFSINFNCIISPEEELVIDSVKISNQEVHKLAYELKEYLPSYNLTVNKPGYIFLKRMNKKLPVFSSVELCFNRDLSDTIGRIDFEVKYNKKEERYVIDDINSLYRQIEAAISLDKHKRKRFRNIGGRFSDRLKNNRSIVDNWINHDSHSIFLDLENAIASSYYFKSLKSNNIKRVKVSSSIINDMLFVLINKELDNGINLSYYFDFK